MKKMRPSRRTAWAIVLEGTSHAPEVLTLLPARTRVDDVKKYIEHLHGLLFDTARGQVEAAHNPGRVAYKAAYINPPLSGCDVVRSQSVSCSTSGAPGGA